MNSFPEIVKTELIKITLSEKGFALDNGGLLRKLEVACERYGTLSPERDNVILICHALSGDAHAAGFLSENDTKPGWWNTMIGPGKGINTDKFHVICSNILGGCMGTTGPGSINPETGKHYATDFPEITIGDMIEVQKLLLDELGINKLYGIIGGSAGGLQVLEWCTRYPNFIEKAVCIASAESLSAQALSFDIIARKTIMADPSWNDGYYYEKNRPDTGLSLARMIGHITYLSKESMDEKFGRERQKTTKATKEENKYSYKKNFDTDFEIENYLNYQGNHFVERFDSNSFLYITSAMDSFSLSDREKKNEIYKKSKTEFMIISLSSDWLYPADQSKELAEKLLISGQKVTYCNLISPYGHDSFLLENKDLRDLIYSFFYDTCKNESEHCNNDAGSGDFKIINSLIEPGSKVLDLGCGDGSFLQKMNPDNNKGHGIDKDFKNIIECNYRDVPAFQVNLDEGLEMIPDNFYDYAILSRTLSEVHKPLLVLSEMLRVAHIGIVSFPNFAKWKHRIRLGLKGKLPRTFGSAGNKYDSPDMHFFSLKDFREICTMLDIQIMEAYCIPLGFVSKILIYFGFCNLGAENIILKIRKKEGNEAINNGCRCLKK